MRFVFVFIFAILLIFDQFINDISATNFSFDAIDGGWSPWSKLVTTCHLKGNEKIVVDCGGGVRKRYRSCTHPVPQGKGRDCEEREDWDPKDRKAVDHEYPCNTHPCQLPDELLWSEWSTCSKSCGNGVMKRHTMCGKIRKRAKDISLPPTSASTTLLSDESTTTSTTTSTSTSTTTTTTSTTTSTSSTSKTNWSDTESNNVSRISSTSTSTSQPITTTKRKSTTTIKTDNPHWIKPMENDFELLYEETCKRNQYKEEYKQCNTWRKSRCDSPCKNVKCPTFAKCHDISNETHPAYECKCQLGTEMKDDSLKCIPPEKHRQTPRPPPSMSPGQKTAVVILTRGASTILIIFLLATLVIFAVARIFDSSRVIHMNMEIALLFAHFFLLPSFHGKSEDVCVFTSILIHFFFTACFIFMLLEAINMYSLVAWVVKSDGLLSPVQNTVFGWSAAFTIVLYNMCFGYEYYGGEYHCWLRMNTPLIYGQYIPIVFITIVTFAIIEAAGDIDGYTKLDDVNEEQRTTAKVIQRTLLLILPMVFTSFILGTLAEFEQNIYLYSVFTLVNGILGAIIFSFHTSANATVRAKVKRYFCRKR